MVINHQGPQAQLLHPFLQEQLSGNITLYRQESRQPDVWQVLNGEKDDIVIYDRCGRLIYHISKPYSIIERGNIEAAIRETYCKQICGDCIHQSTETPEECTIPEPKPEEEETGHSHGTGHGHHHGDRHGVGHGNRHERHHGRNHGHHGSRHGQGHGVFVEQGQQQVQLDLTQQMVDMGQMPQEVQGAPVMQIP